MFELSWMNMFVHTISSFAFSLGWFTKDMFDFSSAIGHADAYLYLEASQLSCSY